MPNAQKKNNVQVHGKPDAAQTLVLGHGFGTDQSAWRFTMDSFTDRFRVITYDNVGAGQSDPGAYSQAKYSKLESYADDVIDLCDAFNVTNAIFIGHSVSGMVGLLASRKAPELFSKHVFMNASPRYLNDTGYAGGFDQKDLNELFDAMATNYYSWVGGFAPAAMGNPEKPQLADEFARTLSEIRPDIALAVSRAIFQSDHRKDLPGFEKESLIIQSNQDIAVPMAVGEYLNKNLTSSKLMVINATGHFPHISAPQEIIRVLNTFL